MSKKGTGFFPPEIKRKVRQTNLVPGNATLGIALTWQRVVHHRRPLSFVVSRVERPDVFEMLSRSLCTISLMNSPICWSSRPIPHVESVGRLATIAAFKLISPSLGQPHNSRGVRLQLALVPLNRADGIRQS